MLHKDRNLNPHYHSFDTTKNSWDPKTNALYNICTPMGATKCPLKQYTPPNTNPRLNSSGHAPAFACETAKMSEDDSKATGSGVLDAMEGNRNPR